MFFQKYIWGTVVLLLCVASLMFVSKSPVDIEEAFMVKTYKVPENRAGELQSTLNNLFKGKKLEGSSYRVAKAQSFGNGILLVKAPESYHQGVKSFLRQVKPSEPGLNQKIALDYWLILSGGDEVKLGGYSSEISSVVKTIKGYDQNKKFRVIEKLAANTGVGQRSKISGWISTAKTNVGKVDDKINLNVTFYSDFGEIKTSTKVSDGEFVVLGQSAARPKKLANKGLISKNTSEETTANNLYYVVRARIVK